MKSLQVVGCLTGVALVGVGVAMAIANPGQAAYNEYAAQQLTAYLEENACPQAPQVLGNLLQNQCVTLLRNNQAEIQQIIDSRTERQNFGILSIYKTNLSVSQLLPSYHFETVGVLQNFYIYKAEEQ